jgi:ribosome-associated protein
MHVITPGLDIAPAELSFSFSRSSGPGGQNVNKVNTRVTLSYDVAHSPSLNDRQRQLIFSRLATRINKLGILRISSDTCRTQQGNKEEVTRRFVHLLQGAVHEQRPRRKTKVSRGARERRLSSKKNRGRIKQLRSRKVSRDD